MSLTAKRPINKTVLHFIIAMALNILISFTVPAVNGLTQIGVRTLGAAVALIYLWLFVGIDWTSLFGIVLFSIAGTMPLPQIVAGSMGSIPAIYALAMCAVTIALSKTGVLNRLINWFITRKILRGRPWLFLGFFFAGVYIVNCFMDIVATCLIALSIAKEVCREIGYEEDEKFSMVMCLGVMWFGMWGYAATPISHTTAIIVIGLVEQYTGISISVLDFMKVGIPSTLILSVCSFLVIRFLIRPDVSKFVNYDPTKRSAESIPANMSKAEKRGTAIFLLMVLAFLFPDIAGSIFPEAAQFVKSLTVAGPVIITVVALILVQADGEPLLDFSVALKEIPWSTVMLIVGMFVIAPCLTADSTGIKECVANILSPLTANMSSWIPLTLVIAAFCAILTNFMSCNAVASIVYAVVAPLAIALSPVVNPLALAMVVAVAANIGVMTPAASAASAIVLGNGVSTVDALRWGAVTIPIATVICMFVVYPLATAVFPF